MKELICIVCPRGCHLKVDEANGYKVTGNSCPRGEQYGKAELKNPVRVLTSTVRIEGGLHRRCPVKTNGAIPKGKIREVMALLNGVTLKAPVAMGQTVIKDVCRTGIDLVTTRDIGIGRSRESDRI